VGKSGGARTGSGVCIRHAGQVLTSDRLVAGASRVEIVTSDGKVQTAGVIGRDPVSDLALLSIDGSLEAADLATTQSLRVGEPVYAVGADTLGTPWVSVGIVSSLAGRVATSSTTMSGLIESNALTEPAVAGGALLDADGRVAGILMTPVEGNPATVAVPIRFAGRVADALRADGHVDHGWLGLAGKVTAGNRLVITALAVGGPSQNAGMRVGDVVVSADAQPIATINDLMATARRYWPGDHIQLDVTRGRDELTISVRLARMPRGPAPATTTSSSPTTTSTTTPSTTQ
jgi:S1-C subfamily serine protease